MKNKLRYIIIIISIVIAIFSIAKIVTAATTTTSQSETKYALSFGYYVVETTDTSPSPLIENSEASASAIRAKIDGNEYLREYIYNNWAVFCTQYGTITLISGDQEAIYGQYKGKDYCINCLLGHDDCGFRKELAKGTEPMTQEERDVSTVPGDTKASGVEFRSGGSGGGSYYYASANNLTSVQSSNQDTNSVFYPTTLSNTFMLRAGAVLNEDVSLERNKYFCKL